MNIEPIGIDYTVDGRTFAPDTPRGILADALEDVGRTDEAALVRGREPAVFDAATVPVRSPSLDDVVLQLRGLREGRVGFVGVGRFGRVGEHFLHHPFPYCWRVCWPLRDTARVYDVLRSYGSIDTDGEVGLDMYEFILLLRLVGIGVRLLGRNRPPGRHQWSWIEVALPPVAVGTSP